jgi:hypothetical protein
MNGDQYYVLWPDGQRFGPADLQTLQRWIVENRVGPATILEDASNGRQLRAVDMPQLQPFLPIGAHFSQGYASYAPSNPYGGTSEVKVAWILGALSLVCCGPLASVAGIVVSIMALSKKQPTAIGALLLNIVALIVNLLGLGLALFSPNLNF